MTYGTMKRLSGAAAALALAVAPAGPMAQTGRVSMTQVQPEDATNPPLRDIPIALIMDADGGTPFYTKDADRRFIPASLTKLMTVYTAFELLKEGRLSLDQRLPVSARTAKEWSGKGSTMFSVANTSLSVDTLLKAIMTVSANDGCVILAQGAAGSIEGWTALMNANAQKLGMNDSHFNTPNGWMDEGRTYTSARDLATLTRALLSEHGDLYQRYFALPKFSYNNITQTNHNPILGHVEGADGLKTGFTNEAGYGFVGSAERDGRRLIMVLGGAEIERPAQAGGTRFHGMGLCLLGRPDDLCQGSAGRHGRRAGRRIAACARGGRAADPCLGTAWARCGCGCGAALPGSGRRSHPQGPAGRRTAGRPRRCQARALRSCRDRRRARGKPVPATAERIAGTLWVTKAGTRGRFIALEGGEGAGKSTQARLLAEALRGRGLDVVTTREPGGTPGAEALRTLLLDHALNWGPRAEALLFAAARSDHVEHLIEPALASGSWVLCDRFVDSSRAYQGGAGGIGDENVLALHAIGSGGLLPDLTMLIELEPAEAASRVSERDGDAADRIGARDQAYHAAVRERFAQLARQTPGRFARIDGQGSAEEVHGRIMQTLAPLLEHA